MDMVGSSSLRRFDAVHDKLGVRHARQCAVARSSEILATGETRVH